jgi:hypothetical protein
MPQIIHWGGALIFGTAIFLLITTTSAQLVCGQRPAKSAQPDFFIHIKNQKAIYYRDETIEWGVSRLQGKPQSSKCRFGGGGTFQILRNGQLIKEEKVGGVSMLSSVKFGGLLYNGYGMSISPGFFVSETESNTKDSYQIRGTCGDEISEPSKRFHVSGWSEPVDGLQVLIRPLKETYQAGEPIMIEATMRNAGTRPRRCPIPRADDGRRKAYWTPTAPYWEDPRPDDENVYTRSLAVLNPGQSRKAIFPLNVFRAPGLTGKPMFGATPGNYKIWFTVFFHQEDEDVPVSYRKNLWRGEMTTNIIEIVVR